MERFYWIELIGFDNESPDYGAEAFISRTVSITGVSILFSHIDFLFENSEELPQEACSYFAHEYNRERRRQNWTREQLKGLVNTLHSKGVKVFLSSFDMTRRITDKSYLTFNSSGAPERLINPVKPLANGKTVGDEIIGKLKKAIDEFNFDGIQLADGLSSARLTIENGDFSIPLCKAARFAVPKELMKDDTETYVKRRAWILKNKRYEWTLYLSALWAEFYNKLFKEIDKPIMFNSTWTRDSFEALYRYGLDYSKCGIDKAYGIMVEENSATRAITSAADEGGVEFSLEHRKSFHYEYALMQQEIKLRTKGLKQISLTPITDTMEQWDAIRHCPTELSRAIIGRYNNFVYRNGKFEVCCNAPHYCLSDGIPASDWQWLNKQESYTVPTPEKISGFVSVFNENTLYRELDSFIKDHGYYGSSLLLELTMGGLEIGAKISLEEIKGFDSAKGIVLTDLKSYTEEEKELLSRSPLPILAVGENVELPIEPVSFYKGKYLSAALYNSTVKPNFEPLKAFEKSLRRKKTDHGELWTEPLSYKRVKSEFFTELSNIITDAFSLDKSLDSSVKISSFILDNAKYTLLSNDNYTYTLAKVKTKRAIKSATALTKDNGYKVRIDNDCFTVRIPPRSLEIVKTEI